MSLYTEQFDRRPMDLIDTADYFSEDCDSRLFDRLFENSSNNLYGCGELDGSTDWIDGFLSDGQNCILGDCMMDASLSAPFVQSEHSYSLATNGLHSIDIKTKLDTELDADEMAAVNPNLMITGNSISTEIADDPVETVDESCQPMEIKPELFLSDEECVLESQPDVFSDSESSFVETIPPPTFVVTCTTKLVHRQPTIIVTRARQSLPFHSSSVLARLPVENTSTAVRTDSNCTVDTSMLMSFSNGQFGYEETQLPPTPPSSSSDSEGGRSPKTSPPSSPQQQTWAQRLQNSTLEKNCPITTTVPSSGVLILTDEEKRTLIAEGYQVPTRLPLTKQEEKNLKKVQRKIKNKMSAQESRRKKKDYVESLEKKLEESNQENSQLRLKMESLESDNRTLLQKLQKLQSLANSLMPSSPLQSSTCLMVFVLFFAVCLGSWRPTTLPFGALPSVSSNHQSEAFSRHSDVIVQTSLSMANDYNTPNVMSRTLKTVTEDSEMTLIDSPMVYGYHSALLGWFSGFCMPQHTVTEKHAADVIKDDKIDDYVFLQNDRIADDFADMVQEPVDGIKGAGSNLNTDAALTADVTDRMPEVDNMTWGDIENLSVDHSIPVEINVTYSTEVISVLV